MAAEDYLPFDFCDDEEERSVFTRCKGCGREDLEWGQTDSGRWRLFTPTGKVHECQEYLKLVKK